MCWSIPCEAAHPRGHASASTCVMSQKNNGPRRKLQSQTMIPHGSGGSVGRTGVRNSASLRGLAVVWLSPPELRRFRDISLIVPGERLPPVLGEEQLQAGRRYNRWASCPFAICGIAPCAGSDLPACDHKQLLQSIQAALAPTTNLCLGSSDSVRRAFAWHPHHFRPDAQPKPSRDGSSTHLCDTALETPPTLFVLPC